MYIMSLYEEAGKRGCSRGDLLYQKVVVQLVGESPIRVNARELGSYSRMFLGNRRCLRENIRPFEWRCETLNFTLIRKLLFV
ncbi:hypothetical protein LIMHP_08385 [Leptospira interrogans serovar Manilae]|nr:hypothetical protein LIMHP_08385 [Leptospira interrogans serovar Manilae]